MNGVGEFWGHLRASIRALKHISGVQRETVGRFLYFRRKGSRRQAAGFGFRVEEENPAGVQVRWHPRSRLAHVSPYCRNPAGRIGRASADHPRLPAAQQSSCHQQISASDIEEQAFRAGEVGGGDSADGISSKNHSGSMMVRGNQKRGNCGLFAYRPLISPDLLRVRTVNA